MRFDMIGPVHEQAAVGTPVFLTGLALEEPPPEPVFERDTVAAGDLLALEDRLRTEIREIADAQARQHQELLAKLAPPPLPPPDPWYRRLWSWLRSIQA
jgi:hypothetical protein